MIDESSLKLADAHWAVQVVDPKLRDRALEIASSYSVDQPASLDAEDHRIIRELALAYEVAVAESFELEDNPEVLLRQGLARGAAYRCFQLLRSIPLPEGSEQRNWHVLHVLSAGYCSGDEREVRVWSDKNKPNLAPLDASSEWTTRLSNVISQCWMRLFIGLEDTESMAVIDMISRLRWDQQVAEASMMSEYKTDKTPLAFFVAALYHWAAATENLATFALSRLPMNIHERLTLHFNQARECASFSGDYRMDVLMRWLHLAANRMVFEISTKASSYTPQPIVPSEIEVTQKGLHDRLLRLFTQNLGYGQLRDWSARGVGNVMPDLLNTFLRSRGYDEDLIQKAIMSFQKVSTDFGVPLYERNKNVYELLRYGVKVKVKGNEKTRTVRLVDWQNPVENSFWIAERVGMTNANKAEQTLDFVVYVNGIAVAVVEFATSVLSIEKGVDTLLEAQRSRERFFSTVQLLIAVNDSGDTRYGTVGTEPRQYLAWKERDGLALPDDSISQLCSKMRLVEMMHDFIAFDSGKKKLCRHNQYFGVKAAQEFIAQKRNGIIWHTQGSGKSMTMVWLARWIRETQEDARVLIITDRTELDAQIESVFQGVHEDIYRARSAADLIAKLNSNGPALICSLVHKFSGSEESDVDEIQSYINELQMAVPEGFRAKGNIFVFVDECHRSQSGALHAAMRTMLPHALFIGFTGTPLLNKDKPNSRAVFGDFIHVYRIDEAVEDGAVLDLRYEARNIELTTHSVDLAQEWLDRRIEGLTESAKQRLQQKWINSKQLLACSSRLERIVADIVMDMNVKPRLMDGRGNALLVAGSIYEACRFYELFSNTELAGKCAVISSYMPRVDNAFPEVEEDMPSEEAVKHSVYRNMLSAWFREDALTALKKRDVFEREVTRMFVQRPHEIRLLIVVNKLLTGFDAPPATYLYLDRDLRDHGLFQAICRVNRVHTADKTHGYIIDYRDSFKSLERSISDYTGGAFSEYDRRDVEGVLENRASRAIADLEVAREAIRLLCEDVEAPGDIRNYIQYFCSRIPGNFNELVDNEPKRQALYRYNAALVRNFALAANDLEASYGGSNVSTVRSEIDHIGRLCDTIKLASADSGEVQAYDTELRSLLDTFVSAEEPTVTSDLDKIPLLQLFCELGEKVVDVLPPIDRDDDTVAAAIDNNVRKLLSVRRKENPKYFQRLWQLLDLLIEQRRSGTLDQRQYLAQMVALARAIDSPSTRAYPARVNTPGMRAIYDCLNGDEDLTLKVDQLVKQVRKDEWRDNLMKRRELLFAISSILQNDELASELFDIIKGQMEY